MSEVLMGWRQATEYGISFASYTDISDADLDSVKEVLVRNFPRNGGHDVGSAEEYEHISIPSRVCESLTRVSPEFIQQRRSATISL